MFEKLKELGNRITITEPEQAAASPEFEEAAERVTAPPEPEPAVEAVPPPLPQPLKVKPEWALVGVRLSFLPFVHFGGPDWRLTDSEAERARPEMQEFLQALLDKYVPALAGDLLARFPEFARLVFALGLVAWLKYQTVAVKRFEMRKRDATAEAEQALREKKSPEPVGAEVVCEGCGLSFAGRELAAAHLPCPGRKKETLQ